MSWVVAYESLKTKEKSSWVIPKVIVVPWEIFSLPLRLRLPSYLLTLSCSFSSLRVLTSWVLVLSLAVKVSLLLWNHQRKVNVDQFLPADFPWSSYKLNVDLFPLVRLMGWLFQEVLEQMTVHSLSILITQKSRKAAIGKWNKSEREVRGRGRQWVSQKMEFFFSLPTPLHRVTHSHHFFLLNDQLVTLFSLE